MDNSDLRFRRAIADSMYASAMNNEQVTIDKVREIVGILLGISRGGKKDQGSAPEKKISKLSLIYAKEVLNEEQYVIIGKKAIRSPEGR